MTDMLSRAAIDRAAASIKILRASHDDGDRAKAFVAGARMLMLADSAASAFRTMRESSDGLLAKAATSPHLLTNSEWGTGDVAELARAYIASIAPMSLLDSIAQFARVLPPEQSNVLVASGFNAGTASEGAPKVVKRVGLTGQATAPTKAAAQVVVSETLMREGGAAAEQLFESELTFSTLRAMNTAVLTALASAPVTAVATANDPLLDLRKGIGAAQASAGYVVAATPAQVADLSLRAESAGGMSTQGGVFRPGVSVIAVEGATKMIVVPASLLALHDFGLIVRRSTNGIVQMDNAPDNPTTASTVMVSLWQSGLVGLIAERSFRLFVGGAKVVEVG